MCCRLAAAAAATGLLHHTGPPINWPSSPLHQLSPRRPRHYERLKPPFIDDSIILFVVESALHRLRI